MIVEFQGQEHEFPDGTPDEAIRAALQSSAQPPKPDTSTLSDLGQSLMTGLRSGAEGLVGLPEDAGHGMRWLNNKAMVAAGFQDRPDYVAGTDAGAGFRGPDTPAIHAATSDIVGPSYQPQTGLGQFTKKVGEFAPAALTGPGGVIRNLATLDVVPAIFSELGRKATEGTPYEPWAEAGGALFGGLAASPFAVGRVATATRQGVMDAAARQNVSVPTMMMEDKPVSRFFAAKLGEMPFAGSPIKAAEQGMSDALGSRAETLAANMGNPNRANAAESARTGLFDWSTQGSRDLSDQVYSRVDALVNPAVTTPLTNTATLVQQMEREAAASTSRSSDSALNLVREAVSRPGGLTYTGLKELRTDIGARMSGKITPEAGTSQPALKRLYGALSEDLGNAVQAAGGPQARQAWDQANNTARLIGGQRDQIAKIIGLKSGVDLAGNAAPMVGADAVLNRITNLATEKNAGNIDRLLQVRRVLPPDAWQDISATLIGRMGRDPTQPATYFSPSRFLTAYGKFSDQGKTALFGAARQHLDDLATLAQQHREFARRGNSSGTAGAVGVASLLGFGADALFMGPMHAMGGLAAAGGTLAASNLWARMLSRPASAQKMVTWARTRAGLSRSTTPSAVQAMLTATRDLSDSLAKETGQDPAAIEQKLLAGTGQSEFVKGFAQ